MIHRYAIVLFALPIVASCVPVSNHIADLRAASFARASELVVTTDHSSDEEIIALAQDEVRVLLKDPDSAQFRNTRTVDYLDGKVVCGEVNAKNSYGGYVGFTPFLAGTNGAMLYETSRYENIERAANAGLVSACH